MRIEAGAVLFAQTGCLNCHVYLGEGSSNLGAPDLSEVGNRLSEEEQKRLRDNAALLKMSMGEYLNGLCITPVAPQASPPASGVRMARAPAP